MDRGADDTTEAAILRRQMVATQIEARGVRDARVLAAMRAVPRECFAAGAALASAYADAALPIGSGQTISQPYMVARMLELLELRGPERVLEVGTGHGYQAAVLAELADTIVSLERRSELARQATENLRSCGTGTVEVVVGDGSVGYPPMAPYDAIVVAAAAPAVPRSLVDQLVEGGRLVVPVGPEGAQVLTRVTRTREGHRREWFEACVFVPLVGEDGFAPRDG